MKLWWNNWISSFVSKLFCNVDLYIRSSLNFICIESASPERFLFSRTHVLSESTKVKCRFRRFRRKRHFRRKRRPRRRRCTFSTMEYRKRHFRRKRQYHRNRQSHRNLQHHWECMFSEDGRRESWIKFYGRLRAKDPWNRANSVVMLVNFLRSFLRWTKHKKSSRLELLLEKHNLLLLEFSL